MNQNFKKWLLSGLISILACAIMLVIIAFTSFVNAGYQKYVLLAIVSILAGYLVLKIVNKIDSVNSSVIIFAVYSTIITSIIIFVTKTILRLDAAMKQLSNNDTTGLNLVSFFGTINPIYSAIVIFLGLNAAYFYYHFKQPEKNWKELIPHLCGIMIMVAVYFVV